MSRTKEILPDKASREVRFGQTTSLQASSGNVVAKPVASYAEQEEGLGKEYRKKMKLLRRLRKKERRKPGWGGSSSSSTLSSTDSDRDSTSDSSTSEDFRPPQKSQKPSKPTANAGDLVAEPEIKRGSVNMLESTSDSSEDKPNLNVNATADVGSVKSLKSSTGSDRENVGVPVKKRGLLRRLFYSLWKLFRRKNANQYKPTRAKTAESKKSVREPSNAPTPFEPKQSEEVLSNDPVSNHAKKSVVLIPTKKSEESVANVKKPSVEKLKKPVSLSEFSQDPIEFEFEESSDLSESDDRQSTMTTLTEEEERQILEHGLEKQTLASYIDLIGLDSGLPLRDEEEIKADQKRIEADKQLTEAKPTQNAVILESIDFDNLDGYDEEFLRLWDMDAGKEILDLINNQSQSYSTELKEINSANEKLAEELEKVRRAKQKAFFHIKDLEAEALAAESKYKKLNENRPAEEKLSKTSAAARNYDILATLLQQREDLFRQLHSLRKKTTDESARLQKQDQQLNKELHDASNLFAESKLKFGQVSKWLEDQKHELGVIQQELEYLVEEVKIFSAVDGKLSKLDVKSAISKLGKRKKDAPTGKNHLAKVLAVLETSLQSLKMNGTDAIKTVEDSHDELQWHLNRREDILKNLIRGYMEQKHIRALDSAILKVLQTQQPNLELLDQQMETQTSLKSVLENRWEETKTANEQLRKEIIYKKDGVLAKKERENANKVKEVENTSRSFAREKGDVKIQTSKHLYHVDSNEEMWDEMSLTGSESWSQA